MTTKKKNQLTNVETHKSKLRKIKSYKKLVKSFIENSDAKEKGSMLSKIQSMLDKFKQNKLLKPNKVSRLISSFQIKLNEKLEKNERN
jgi:ribosomal protein S20